MKLSRRDRAVAVMRIKRRLDQALVLLAEAVEDVDDDLIINLDSGTANLRPAPRRRPAPRMKGAFE